MTQKSEYELRVDFNFTSCQFHDSMLEYLLKQKPDNWLHRVKYVSPPKDVRLTTQLQRTTNEYLTRKYHLLNNQRWHLRKMITNSDVPSVNYQLKVTTSTVHDYMVHKLDTIPISRAVCLEIELDAEDIEQCGSRIQVSGQYCIGGSIALKPLFEINQKIFHFGQERFTLATNCHQNEKIHYSFHIEREFDNKSELLSFYASGDLSTLAIDCMDRALLDSKRSEVYEFINPLCVWKLFNLNGSRCFKLPRMHKIVSRYIAPKLDGVRRRGAVVCGRLMVPSKSKNLDELCRRFDVMGVHGNYFVIIEELDACARIIDVLAPIEARFSAYASKIINNKHHTLVKCRKFNTREAINLMQHWGPDVCNTFYELWPDCSNQQIRQIANQLLTSTAQENIKIDGLLAFADDLKTIYKIKLNHTIEMAYSVAPDRRQVRIELPPDFDTLITVQFVFDSDHILNRDGLYCDFGRPLLEFELALVGGGVVAKFVRFRFDKFEADSWLKIKRSVAAMMANNGDMLKPLMS